MMHCLRRAACLCAAALLFSLAPLPASAQLPDQVSDEAEISLVTILPGDQIWSLFGHSAFRVHDPLTGADVLFNYGTFDFRNPITFGLQFAYGKLDYMLSTSSFADALFYYRQYENRSVIEQKLSLTPEQVQAVYRKLAVNALPENRTYRYDFLFDNCSTRLRDVLEETLGPEVRFAPRPDPNLSFRRLLDPYVAGRRFLDLGFDLLLGLPTDRKATPREATFLPLNLMTSFDNAQVVNVGGARPLVSRTDTLYWSGLPALPTPAPRWPLMLTALLLAGGAYATYAEFRGRERAAQILDRTLFATVGVVGLILLFMWLGTEHRVTARNLNMLWAWPTHLAAAVALGKRSSASWLRLYFPGAAAVALVAAMGWAAWPQGMHPALLPVALLLGLRSAARAYQMRTSGGIDTKNVAAATHRDVLLRVTEGP